MAAFTKCFKNDKGIMETQHGKLTLSKYIKTLTEYDALKLEKVKLDSEEAYKKFIACTFMQGTGQSRMVKLGEDLSNQFALGVKSYPRNLENATTMILNYKNYVNNPNHPGKKKQQSNKYLDK